MGRAHGRQGTCPLEAAVMVPSKTTAGLSRSEPPHHKVAFCKAAAHPQWWSRCGRSAPRGAGTRTRWPAAQCCTRGCKWVAQSMRFPETYTNRTEWDASALCRQGIVAAPAQLRTGSTTPDGRQVQPPCGSRRAQQQRGLVVPEGVQCLDGLCALRQQHCPKSGRTGRFGGCAAAGRQQCRPASIAGRYWRWPGR